MKLNHECVRQLMLFIEENLEYDTYISVDHIELPKFEHAEIVYAADKLLEAHYLSGEKNVYSNHNSIPTIYIKSITWDGHKFLDSIRDNKVWKKTKEITSKFSSVSISMIEHIASNVIVEIIKDSMAH